MSGTSSPSSDNVYPSAAIRNMLPPDPLSEIQTSFELYIPNYFTWTFCLPKIIWCFNNFNYTYGFGGHIWPILMEFYAVCIHFSPPLAIFFGYFTSQTRNSLWFSLILREIFSKSPKNILDRPKKNRKTKKCEKIV